MKLNLSVAVFITFLAFSLSSESINLIVILAGIIVAVLTFLSLKHIEERRSAYEKSMLVLTEMYHNQKTQHQEKIACLDRIHALAVKDGDNSKQLGELLSKLISQLNEEQMKSDEQLLNQTDTIVRVVDQHKLELSRLVQSLLEISSEITESKDIVREKILYLQENYLNELKSKV